ncbi:MAG: hypothetical protein MSG78_09075 [Clostridiales bacterium]|nr:hypothetical protein [Clostridiales bacterium]
MPRDTLLICVSFSMPHGEKNEGSVPTRGSGNYASDEAKEIARLQRELRDTKDALEV